MNFYCFGSKRQEGKMKMRANMNLRRLIPLKRMLRLKLWLFSFVFGCVLMLTACGDGYSSITSNQNQDTSGTSETYDVKENNWIIEMTIYATGHTGSDYLIQIDENNKIRAGFGTRREWDIDILGEEFFYEIRVEEKDTLNETEMEGLLHLLQELETTEGIMELDIADGSWEVILIYNGIVYGMDYWTSDFEPLREVIDEILRLSPLEVELHGWS